MFRRASSAVSTGGVAFAATSTAARTGFFSEVPLAPPDMILGISREFSRDPHPKKVNLAVGVYRDEESRPYVLECVKRASAMLPMTNMDYAPINGVASYVESAQRICFGDELLAANTDRLASVQTLSGTGALRIAGDFLKLFGTTEVHLPTPTYLNHLGIFHDVGLGIKSYPYYSAEKHELQLEQMLCYIEKLPAGSVVLLQAAAHNPTGFDPTPDQWNVIVDTIATHKLVPFVDMAYQGFATGDLERDGFLPRLLLRSDVPVFLLAQSFAKNFGLYGQRTGALHICCGGPTEKGHILSQTAKLIRASYSNPPLYGAQLVDTIVRDPELHKLWLSELTTMSNRMASVRQKLYESLKARGVTRPIAHLKDGCGMMALSGLSQAEVLEIRAKHHVYMISNGRIAFSGLTDKNLDNVADAMSDIMNKK